PSELHRLGRRGENPRQLERLPAEVQEGHAHRLPQGAGRHGQGRGRAAGGGGMRKLAAILLAGLTFAVVVTPVVAKPAPVTVPINIWWATRPDAQPHLKTIPMQFPTADIASKD